MSALTMDNHGSPDNVTVPRVHPQKFMLWAGIACMVMLFAGLTSAYIVRKGAGNWVEFMLPYDFIISSIVLLLSSATLHWAVVSFKKDDLGKYRLALGSTVLLSLLFLGSQYMGWLKLEDIGIYLSGNPSGSFVYVISYLHVAHVAIGILLLFSTFIRSFIVFNNPADFLIYRTDSNKKVRIELLATYWHFVDLLWLYLVLFFMLT